MLTETTGKYWMVQYTGKYWKEKILPAMSDQVNKFSICRLRTLPWMGH